MRIRELRKATVPGTETMHLAKALPRHLRAWIGLCGLLVQLTQGGDGVVPPKDGGGSRTPAPPALDKILVTNTFYDTSLRQALSDLAAQTGTTIVADMAVQGLVSCDLKDTPLLKALDILLGGSNCEYRLLDGFILVGTTDAKSPVFDKLSESEVITTNYISADLATKMLPASYSAYVKANKDSNTVLVTAPDQLRQRVVDTLRKIDIAPKHIMLEARVVVLEHGGLLNLGTQWSWPQLAAGTFSNSDLHGVGSGNKWPWGLQIGYSPDREFTNALLLKLNLLEQNSEATVIATPRLLAQDHKEAEIKATTAEYFRIVTGGAYEQIELETIDTGTTLKILPVIAGNGDITLKMEVEVSDVVARGQDNLPVVTRRSTANTVRVHDGGTVAIAGLTSSQLQQVWESVPGFASIPGLGRGFKNDASSYAAREVAVFVTASLMSEDQDGTPLAPEAKPRFEYMDTEAFRRELRASLAKLRAEQRATRPRR